MLAVALHVIPRRVLLGRGIVVSYIYIYILSIRNTRDETTEDRASNLKLYGEKSHHCTRYDQSSLGFPHFHMLFISIEIERFGEYGGCMGMSGFGGGLGDECNRAEQRVPKWVIS